MTYMSVEVSNRLDGDVHPEEIRISKCQSIVCGFVLAKMFSTQLHSKRIFDVNLCGSQSIIFVRRQMANE